MCLLEFPAITSLSLSHVFLPSVTDLGRLILSIPALRTLECARVGFKKDGLDFRGLPPRVTRLRLSSVGLDDCPEKDIVELLLATSTGEHIEALDVRMSIAAYGVRRLLQHSGKALRTLRMFGFPSPTPFDLSHNIHLEELVIGVPKFGTRQIQLILETLRTITSRAMREIEVFVWSSLDSGKHIDEDVCAAIDDVLSNPPFATIRKFRLTFKYRFSEPVERYIPLFPTLLQRRVLSIELRDWH